MSIFRPDDDRISSSIEGARQANRTSGVQRAMLRMRGWFIEEPKSAGETGAAGVTDINEARAAKAEASEVMDGGGIEPRPAQTDAEGNVVDMRAHRMQRAARQEIDEAYAAMPDNGLDEEFVRHQSES